MDFRVVTIVVMLCLTTPVHGRILERDTSQRATCTAPVATKGEAAVVTCHYPLDVKQPGEIVAVRVERYPFTSSSTGSPHSDLILDCVSDEDYTCTLDEEEHRVEGKEVVITIKNVTEDNQGRYLCKMMVKDGPNIHGEPCQLLVNGTDPSDLLASTTDPGLDQPTTRDNETSSGGHMAAGTIAGIVVGCVLLLAIVVVAVICCMIRRNAARQREKAQNGETEEQHTLSEMENGGAWHHDNTEEGNGACQRGTTEKWETDDVERREASHHDSAEESQDSADDPYKKTVPEKVELIEEKERNQTASLRPQSRPPAWKLKKEKETEIKENQNDAEKTEDEKKEDEQKQDEEKKEDEQNEEDKEEADKESEEDKEEVDKGNVEDKEEEEEEEEDGQEQEQKAETQWLLSDQSQTQNRENTAEPEYLEM